MTGDVVIALSYALIALCNGATVLVIVRTFTKGITQ
jgi:hypothetical protein